VQPLKSWNRLFNPAITFSLWLIGGISTLRGVLEFERLELAYRVVLAASLTVAQLIGGILGAGLVDVLTPQSVGVTRTTLAAGMNKGMGLMLEAFLTAMLVFTVLMLAAEKHRATYLAPVGIGLVLFSCQLFGTQWTGCGMNNASESSLM
jgi:aquaporin related protein